MRAKIAALALGLVGVAIIVRPGATTMDPGHLIVLAAALAFGISVVMVKSLTRTESAVAIIFWMLVIQSAIGLVPALWEWRWPSAAVWPWIVVAAFCGSFAHYCQARALMHADATVVMPMDFLRVPLAALIGYLLYSESIDLMTALGAGLILLGNLLNLQRGTRAGAGGACSKVIAIDGLTVGAATTPPCPNRKISTPAVGLGHSPPSFASVEATPMQYAILCYDDEKTVEAWSQAREDEVIGKHRAFAGKLARQGKLGPVLRLLPNSRRR